MAPAMIKTRPSAARGARMGSYQPRWLDSEERQAWMALVAVLMRLPAALDSQLQRDAGISHFEYQVMAGLWEKVVQTAPGHVEAVRALVIDPLTKAQKNQLTGIGRRILHAIDPDDDCTGPRPA